MTSKSHLRHWHVQASHAGVHGSRYWYNPALPARPGNPPACRPRFSVIPVPAESGNGGFPDSRFRPSRESGIPSPFPGQIGNRGNGDWGFPGLLTAVALRRSANQHWRYYYAEGGSQCTPSPIIDCRTLISLFHPRSSRVAARNMRPASAIRVLIRRVQSPSSPTRMNRIHYSTSTSHITRYLLCH